MESRCRSRRCGCLAFPPAVFANHRAHSRWRKADLQNSPGERLAAGLRKRGLQAESRTVEAEDCPVSVTLQEHAIEAGAEMLVMGGYGHSGSENSSSVARQKAFYRSSLAHPAVSLISFPQWTLSIRQVHNRGEIVGFPNQGRRISFVSETSALSRSPVRWPEGELTSARIGKRPSASGCTFHGNTRAVPIVQSSLSWYLRRAQSRPTDVSCQRVL